MRPFIIAYIALGLVLSLAFGVEYKCEGQEMFPTYYGSPIVFKQESLGSSIAYFYSISALLINVAIWSVLIYIISTVIQLLIRKSGNHKALIISHKLISGILIAFTTLQIAIGYVMLGSGFNHGRNYWYMNLDKEAKDWNMKCEGEWKLLIK